MKSFVINEVCHPNLPELLDHDHVRCECLTCLTCWEMKRKQQLKQMPYKWSNGGMEECQNGRKEGSRQCQHPPTNNLIFSLSTAKCARTHLTSKEEFRKRGGVGGSGVVCCWCCLTDTLTDAFLTLTDRLTFGWLLIPVSSSFWGLPPSALVLDSLLSRV